MRRYRAGVDSPIAVIPNLSKQIVTSRHLKTVAKRWGISLWNQLRLTDPDTGKIFITPHKYMVLKLQVCRLVQMQEIKRGIPSSNRIVDELTNQVTGASKGAAFSMPEAANTLARGNINLVTELVGPRGGDEAANRALEYQIAMTGSGSLEAAMAQGTGAKATKVMAAYIRTQQLDTDLDKKER
ncbi:MAG: hypothetical protein EOM43_14520 [Gammaproteobacteria bacterium]|nr:hypothetical protein [Gammaproteobacteria bacterium]